MSIADAPRFAYRGVMLDPCRHFLTVDAVKKQIDLLSSYKINRLHWHLTEDQGWRVE
ncbi:family 20 glycosylhydrolase, partial [Acinetobacter pittii]|uniref:family 20 glycosylhydrolase n=1 Tax=Acinetobacter pittii TaxID=48296 RepID=UPI0035BE441D